MKDISTVLMSGEASAEGQQGGGGGETEGQPGPETDNSVNLEPVC